MVPYSDHHLNNELKVRYSGHGLNSELKVRYSNGCISLDRFIFKLNNYLNIKWSMLNDRLSDRLPNRLRPFE